MRLPWPRGGLVESLFEWVEEGDKGLQLTPHSTATTTSTTATTTATATATATASEWPETARPKTERRLRRRRRVQTRRRRESTEERRGQVSPGAFGGHLKSRTSALSRPRRKPFYARSLMDMRTLPVPPLARRSRDDSTGATAHSHDSEEPPPAPHSPKQTDERPIAKDDLKPDPHFVGRNQGGPVARLWHILLLWR